MKLLNNITVDNQGSDPYCTLFAVANLIDHALHQIPKDAIGSKYNINGAAIMNEVVNIYEKVKAKNPSKYPQSGLGAVDCLSDISDNGGIPFRLLAPNYVGDKKYPSLSKGHVKIQGYKLIDLKKRKTLERQVSYIKRIIDKGEAIYFDIATGDDWIIDNRISQPARINGGHAMIIIGYNEDVDGDINEFIVQNSWGSSSGDGGLLYLPVNMIPGIGVMLTVKLDRYEDPNDIKENGTTISENFDNIFSEKRKEDYDKYVSNI